MESNKKSLNFLPYVIISIFTVIISVLGCVLIVNLFSVRNVSRTVMVYMVGADLESNSGLASGELAGIKHPEKVLENGVRVVLIAGGSKRWHNDYISEDETSIFELTADGFSKVKTQKLKNMGESKTLSDFINFSTETFPADDYDLIFWNHGAAILGSEIDELQDDDYISIKELKEGLSKTIFSEPDTKLESVIFATCLNGTLEIANALSDYSRYLVASEEISVSYPGTSDFVFLEDISPHDDGDAFGEKFVEKYQEKISEAKKKNKALNQKVDVYSTYSVVDLSKIDDVNAAVDEFFGSIDSVDNYQKISKIRSKLYQYANEQQAFGKEPSYDMVDLYNLAQKLDDLTSVSASRVTTALEEAIIYNYATNSESRGLSIYFPYNADKKVQEFFLDFYDELAPSAKYSKFITKFNEVLAGGSSSGKALDLSNTSGKVSSKTSSSADFTLELTSEQAANFARGRYMVYRSNPKSPGYYWPTYISKSVELDGTTLKANVRGRQLMVKDNDDNSEHTITVIESEETDDYINYEFSVVLGDYRPEDIKDWRTDAAGIRISRDKSNNNISVADAYLLPKTNKDSDKTETKVFSPKSTSRIHVDITSYQSIAFVSSSYNVINDDMTFNENFESNGVIEGWEVNPDELSFTLQENFDDGYDYYCVFQVWDIYNNKTTSKFVKLK